MKEGKQALTNGIERLLQQHGLNKKDIELLTEPIKERLELFKDTYTYKYFVQTKPDSSKRGPDAWTDRENEVINKIRSLYKKHTTPPLSDRRINSNMAIVFAATDFWTNHKRSKNRIGIYYERLKKHSKDQSELPELFDPPYVPKK